MKIAKIECLLRVSQNGNINILQIPKAGPDALMVTEIPILRMINDIQEGGDSDCCISDVRQVDVVEADRNSEIERLKGKYGDRIVNTLYPGGRGLPSTVEDCELPPDAMPKRSAKPKEAA